MREDLRSLIEQVLDQSVRPSMQLHRGDVQVLDVTGDLLRVRMLGACSGCPSASITTEQLIQAEICAQIPEIQRVELVVQTSDQLLDLARAILQRAPA